MVAFKSVKVGDVLWDVRRQRSGNTMLRRTAVWPVRVLEIKEHSAVVSWNHNPPREWGSQDFKRLRRSKPRMP